MLSTGEEVIRSREAERPQAWSMTSQRNPSRRVKSVDRRREIALARLAHGVFTTEQARTAGLTRSDLRSDAVTPVIRGVYAHRGTDVDHHLRCRAALLVAPLGIRITGLSAARLLGLPVPHDDRISIAVTKSCDMHTQATRRSRAVIDDHIWVRNSDDSASVPVTSHPHLLAECVEHLALVDAVVLGDAIANRLQTGLEHVAPGRAVLRARWRQVLGLIRAGSESPVESRLRMLLILAGLPEPVLQYVVSASGRTRRLDLAYPELQIAIEYDGEHHFTSEWQFAQDALRLDALARDGWIVVRVIARDLYREPERVVERVASALRQRGESVVIDPAWREHFPSRPSLAA